MADQNERLTKADFPIDEVTIYDEEVYPNYFLIAFFNTIDGWHRFEIAGDVSDSVDDLLVYLKGRTLAGWNNHQYDDLLLLALLDREMSSGELWTISDDIINFGKSPWEVRGEMGLPDPVQFDFNTIDIMQIIPGRIGLKLAGARTHYKRLQELPFDPMEPVVDWQVKELRNYCRNDVGVTGSIFRKQREQLELRQDMSVIYGTDLRSKGDASIANIVLAKMYAERKSMTLNAIKKLIHPAKSFHYTPPKYLRTNDPYLSTLIDLIRSIKFHVAEHGAVMFPKELSDIVVTIGDRSYNLGLGGLHSIDCAGMYEEDEEHRIIDLDVTSYYPAIMLNSEFYPEHMGPEFLAIYKEIVDRRIKAKREGRKVEANSLKIVANGTFGQTSQKYSYLYDPSLTIHVTLTGQLALLILINAMEKKGIPVISANTDGITMRIHHDQESKMNQIAASWENQTGFNLERADYRLLARRDVNSYIAIQTNGKAKTKGFLSPQEDIQHNPANRIVMEAIVAFLQTGAPVERTIEDCRDLTGFLTVRRVTGGALDADKKSIGSIVRYYYSTHINETDSLTYVKSGNKVPDTDGAKPVIDLPGEFPEDIDVQRYIREAKEKLAMITVPCQPWRNKEAAFLASRGLSPVPADHEGVTVVERGYDFSACSNGYAAQTGFRASSLAVRVLDASTDVGSRLEAILDSHPSLQIGKWHFFAFDQEKWPGTWTRVNPKKKGIEVRYGRPVALDMDADMEGEKEPLPEELRRLIWKLCPKKNRDAILEAYPFELL